MGMFIPPGVSTGGGSGTPGGNSGEAQFNNAGALAGAAGLTIDPTTGRLTLASFLATASAPATPASAGFALYAAPTTGALSWRGANGFIRTLNATGNTADRSYQFQDKSGTLAHLDDVFDGYAVGNYIMPINGATTTASSLVANIIYMQPFKVDRSIRINELAARVGTAVASSLFQLAIYNSANGLPAAPLASTADMSGANATVLSSSVAEATILAGRTHWWAINSSISGLAMQVMSNLTSYANAIVGAETLAIVSSGPSASTWSRQFSQTYGTWPNLTGQTTTLSSGSRVPVPILRVSALL